MKTSKELNNSGNEAVRKIEPTMIGAVQETRDQVFKAPDQELLNRAFFDKGEIKDNVALTPELIKVFSNPLMPAINPNNVRIFSEKSKDVALYYPDSNVSAGVVEISVGADDKVNCKMVGNFLTKEQSNEAAVEHGLIPGGINYRDLLMMQGKVRKKEQAKKQRTDTNWPPFKAAA